MTQEPFLVKLRREGEPELELGVLQLVVGNGPFHGGGRRVSPEATLHDSKLDVYAILAGARSDRLKLPRAYQLLRIGARMNKGRHVHEKDVLQYRTSALEVEATPPQPANVDGELLHQDTLTFSVVPQALTVIAP
jgi:diacylglycerol kinase family enzyme